MIDHCLICGEPIHRFIWEGVEGVEHDDVGISEDHEPVSQFGFPDDAAVQS